MHLTDEGIDIFTKDLQAPNAHGYIVINEDGFSNSISVMELDTNAPHLIDITEDGIVILVTVLFLYSYFAIIFPSLLKMPLTISCFFFFAAKNKGEFLFKKKKN